MIRKNAIRALFGVAALMPLMTACSKDDGEVMPGGSSNYKITVTLNNVNTNEDFVSFVFTGGTLSGKTDVWKVNGAVRTGESAISLSKNDFTGNTKTYVIETVEPIRAFAGGVQVINYGESLPVSYQIERGKEVKVKEELTLSGDGADITKQYSF